MKLKEYKKAEAIIQKLTQDHNDDELITAEILLIKARLMEKLNNPTEAAINYEQAAKYGSSKISSLALYKFAKFRMRQQDYYEALFNVKRLPIKCQNKKIETFRSFIDGVFSIKL